MKTNFNKLALAVSSVAVLAGASVPAHAIITGAPGEAQLVPFATYSTVGALNTIVRLTVPKSVGNGVIANCYTAPNSTPTNSSAGFGCNNVAPGSEAPGAAGLATSVGGSATSYIHYYFLDQNSNHRFDGKIATSQDDVAIFDLQNADPSGAYNGFVGYLVFVTETANTGAAANFQFSADAYLVDTFNPLIHSVSIPSIPMADGKDTTDLPTLSNNVIEYNTSGSLVVIASPLVTGQETIWSDGKSNQFVFDIAAGSTIGLPVTGAQVAYTGALEFIWNDRNAAAWKSVTAYRYNNNEASCSGNLSLPYQLNLFYLPPAVSANGLAASIAQTPASSTVVPPGISSLTALTDPYAKSASAAAFPLNNICTPANNTAQGSSTAELAGLAGGFVKLVLPEPIITSTNGPAGAAVTWTIPVDGAGNLYSTILGHSRGAFTIAPN